MGKEEAITAKPPARRSDFTGQLADPFSQLKNEMDRLFDSFGLRMPSLRVSRAIATCAPAVEMTETDKSYKISAEMPGMNAEDVELTFDQGMLRIAGEKKEEREENERGYRVSERSYGRFERIIDLPEASDEDGIEASFRNGVLSITVPKVPEAQQTPRKIAIASK